jgi:hypothetical protein
MAAHRRVGQQQYRVRFWQKVLAALLVVGVVPIALVSVVSIQKTRTDLTDLGVTNIQQRSTSTAAALDAYLQNRLDDIVLVSRLPDVVRYATIADPATTNAAREALKAAAARSAEYESVAVVDMTGKIAAASIVTDEGTDVKFRQYFITPSTTAYSAMVWPASSRTSSDSVEKNSLMGITSPYHWMGYRLHQ